MRKQLFLSAALALVATASLAQTPPARTVTLSLSPPTKFEDGSTLDCTAAGKCLYSIYRGVCGATLTKVVDKVAPTSIPVPQSVPGQCFRATATAEGAESDLSIEARFKGKPGSPAITIVITIDVQ
jgi:hypothetical protein